MEPLADQYLPHDSFLIFTFTIEPNTHHLGQPGRIGNHRCSLAVRNLLGHSRAAAAAAAVQDSRRIHRNSAEVADEHEALHNPADEL